MKLSAPSESELQDVPSVTVCPRSWVSTGQVRENIFALSVENHFLVKNRPSLRLGSFVSLEN